MEIVVVIFFVFGALCFYFGLVSLLYYPLALAYPIWEAIRLRKARKQQFTPKVSVLIAAYNEEKTIALSLQTILKSNYPDFEVIIVNDGSTDNTEVEIQPFLSDSRVRYFTKPNGGKASALNRGLDVSNGEIVLFTDADSIFEEKTIINGVGYFVDSKVDAVSGNDTPLHPRGLMQKMLVITSHIGTGFVRRALSMINVLPIISGNLGLVRTQLLRDIGGFNEVWGEDLEVTVRLHRAGARIVYGGSTRVLADCPSTISGLWKQRVRWLRSYIKVMRMHYYMLGNPRYGLFGPFLAFNAFNMVLIPPLQAMGLVLLPFAISSGEFSLQGWEWFAYLGWGFLFTAATLAILLDKTPRDVLYLPYASLLIFFSHFYNAVVVYSLWAELRRKPESWNKLERRDIKLLGQHPELRFSVPVAVIMLFAAGIGTGYWLSDRNVPPIYTTAAQAQTPSHPQKLTVAIHFDAWDNWRDAYKTLLATPQAHYVSRVGISAGRMDWTYFRWPNHERWWSYEQTHEKVSMLEEAVKNLHERGFATTAILDVHAPRYIRHHPEAAAVDEQGNRSEDVVCDTELVSGKFGQLLRKVVEALASSTKADSIAITELFYDRYCFSKSSLESYRKATGQNDWPRMADGHVNHLDPGLMHWRSTEVASVIKDLANIVHRHGKQLYVDVRVSRDDITRNSAENGQDYTLLAPWVDKFVVWDYFALSGLPPESSAKVAAYFNDEYGPDRSFLSIGLWDKPLLGLSSIQGTERYISPSQLERALNAASMGGATDLWITPAKELTPRHWEVLAHWMQTNSVKSVAATNMP